jgi:hypothetical protein
MKKELIVSVNPVIPNKGSNAGKQMFVINGIHWSRTEPKLNDTHVVTEEVTVEGVKYTNVVGFSSDVRMDIHSKIDILTKHDQGYAMAIATLLR